MKGRKQEDQLSMDDELNIVGDHRPTRADAVKNRALLLTTAQHLFAEQGVEAVSMSAIAEAAQVGKGTLYRHFPNKTDLCMALLDQDQRDLQERALQRFRLQLEPCANLRWFLTETVAFLLRNESFLGAAMKDAPNPLEHPAHTWWRQTIRSLLGQANPPGDLDYIADVLYVLLNIQTILFQRRSLGYSSERIQQGLLTTLDKLLT
jgi:AcrR family transcriptional regulator